MHPARQLQASAGAGVAAMPPIPSVCAASPPALHKDTSNTLHCLLATSLVSLLFVFSLSSSTTTPSLPSFDSTPRPSHLLLSSSLPLPPSLAYLLSGSDGDAPRLLRLLRAVYHPRNLYLLHLDRSAPQAQRLRLALEVRAAPPFAAAGNVHVVGNASFADPRGGPSALAATLRAAAVLLRLGRDWDWFVNLGASDYPLVTQDDLLHTLSFLPRDLNFIQHTSHFGWRESRKIKRVIVDPGLYLSAKTVLFYGTQKRELPDAFKLFTGSASVILSRKFVEFAILGTDNFPRSLLMYSANTLSSQNNYFHTLVCNTGAFNNTVINNDLHYTAWDTPPRHDPRALDQKDFDNMTESGAVFGSRFLHSDSILDRIDMELLNRVSPQDIVYGGWCSGTKDPCSVIGDIDTLFPGAGARRLERLMMQVITPEFRRSHQCISE